MKRFTILSVVLLVLGIGLHGQISGRLEREQRLRDICVKLGMKAEWVEWINHRGRQSPYKSPNLNSGPAISLSPEEKSLANEQCHEVLLSAINQLKSYHSIQTNIQQIVFMNGARFEGTGTYLQSGTKRLKLQLKMQAGSSTGELVQVSDGQLLWTEYRRGPIPPNLPEDQLSHYFRIERRSLDRIEDKISLIENHQAGRHLWDLGQGGLTALLTSLDDSLSFRLGDPRQIQGNNCYTLIGELNTQSLETKKYLDHKRSFVAKGSFPFKVKLYLEETQLFPLRYEFYLADKQSGETPLLQVECSHITFNGAVDIKEFVYEPPVGFFPKDVTRDYLDRVKVRIAQDQPQMLK